MRNLPVILLSGLLLCPTAITAQNLFDSALNTTPEDQGWPFVADPLFTNSVTQVAMPNGTVLDTLDPISDRGGYFSTDPLFGIFTLPNAPRLDRHSGFEIEFSLRIDVENHATGSSGDDNGDGLADRAGFSVIAISSDLRGVELSFWRDSIWVQDDDRNGPASLFTQAESATMDTTATMSTYQLQVLGDRYRVLVDGELLPALSGRLRDYQNFTGTLDPYEIKDFLFFGDNTTRGESRVELGSIAANGVPSACEEIDAIVADVISGTNDDGNDLTGDGAVTERDIQSWLSIGGEFYLPQNGAFQPGDANLDGYVDGSDFNIWNDHRTTGTPGWCGGDFDANGRADAEDFAIWQANAFGRALATANVPEPNGQALVLLLVWVVDRAMRRALVRTRSS